MELKIINQPASTCCDPSLPIAVIGAGPIGLAAAAHLKARNLPFFVLEAGDLAENVRSWSHVILFSPWQYNIDATAKALLEKAGWLAPADETIPTGKELIEQYLEPLAAIFKEKIYSNHRVIAITREETDRMKSTNRAGSPFQIYVETTSGVKVMKAGAVIDATGTWGNPNPALSNGLLLKSEQNLHDSIDYHIPNVQQNKADYVNKQIAVIGGGHSAINSLLQLAELKAEFPQTNITWVLRKQRVEEAFGGGSNDELAARGELGLRIAKLVKNGTITVQTPFRIQSISKTEQGIQLKASTGKLEGLDRLIVNTGNRPDFQIHSELRFEVEAITEAVPAIAPLIDPNEHSCGSVAAHGEKELRQPEPNFYIVGSKSYGRAPTFLLATGYEQIRSVVAHLAGDTKAAQHVQLNLPETGVCHSGAGGCC